MRAFATDVVRSADCQWGTPVSRAKADEPIEMPLAGRTRVSQETQWSAQ